MARPPRIELDDYLPYLVNRLGVALSARFAKDTLARRSLSIEMWRVLAVLSSQGEHRHADLGVMTSIDISTLSRMVSRLVRAPCDGRRAGAGIGLAETGLAPHARQPDPAAAALRPFQTQSPRSQIVATPRRTRSSW